MMANNALNVSTWSTEPYTMTEAEIHATLTDPFFSKSIDLLFGLLLLTLAFFGIIENFSVFGMFFKFRKELASRTTFLMMSLALSDFIMSAVGSTMFSISSLRSKWPFGYTGCVFYAFVMFAAGCVDIAHLTVIAVDRMLAIASPIQYRSWSNKPFITVGAIIFSWVYGTIWAFLPLVGFQRYTYEGTTSCSIDWLSKKPVDVTYNYTIFIMSYLVPLVGMVGSYGFIYLTVKASGKKFAGDENAASKKKRDIEVKLAKNFSMVIVVYMFAWTPYTIVSMWSSFGDPTVIPSPARGFPAVLAKCSCVINPLLYVLSNKEHRKRLRAFYGMKVGSSAVAPAPAEGPATTQAAPTNEARPVGSKLEIPDAELTMGTEC